MLLATSKRSSEVGEIFLIWEFYLWNYCRGWWSASKPPSPQMQTRTNIFLTDYLSSPFCRVLRTPRRRPWRPVSVEWSGWFVVFWASWDPSHRPPSPGLRCLSLAWCPTPHRHFSLQTDGERERESFLCIISTGLNRLHPFSQWQSADKYISSPSLFREIHTPQVHNQRRHMCFSYFVINLLQKEKATCTIRLTEVSGSFSGRAQWNMHICHRAGRCVTCYLLRSALSDLH